MTEKVVWHVVREFTAKAAIERLAPHDLRRTCARLCHELEANWSKSNCCLATCRSRPRRDISAASSESGQPSTTNSASNQRANSAPAEQ